MPNEWDDEGEFENLANLSLEDFDTAAKDPFDLSKALEGAALEPVSYTHLTLPTKVYV